MQKFERADFEVQEYVESENYGKFVLSPLERGFGTTIGMRFAGSCFHPYREPQYSPSRLMAYTTNLHLSQV